MLISDKFPKLTLRSLLYTPSDTANVVKKIFDDSPVVTKRSDEIFAKIKSSDETKNSKRNISDKNKKIDFKYFENKFNKNLSIRRNSKMRTSDKCQKLTLESRLYAPNGITNVDKTRNSEMRIFEKRRKLDTNGFKERYSKTYDKNINFKCFKNEII